MAHHQDDYLIVKVDNQSNIEIIQIDHNRITAVPYHQQSNSTASTSSFQLPASPKEAELIEVIRNQLKLWIDSLGIQSAEAQNLKEPITCHTRFCQGSFRLNSPHKHKDLIYFLVKFQSNSDKPSADQGNNCNNDKPNTLKLTAAGFIRIGYRNLFLQHSEQLVNVNRCFSILDFFVKRQRQGLGKLLISSVLNDQTIIINKCAFDRPTTAMLSFLGKHFNLGSPQKQHNHFVIYDGFFA